jgi:hypothetical protein
LPVTPASRWCAEVKAIVHADEDAPGGLNALDHRQRVVQGPAELHEATGDHAVGLPSLDAADGLAKA